MNPFITNPAVNTNPKTGIAYGVIAMHYLHPDLWDAVYMYCRNLTYEAAVIDLASEHLPHKLAPQAQNWKDLTYDLAVEILEEEDPRRLEGIEISESRFEGTIYGVDILIDWLGGAPHLWVLESPHTTHADPCSPCVPGAGDLSSLNPDGLLCYDVPADWRQDY